VNRPLDRIDLRILTELQKDARLSNKELAARVDLAPSSCLERVRRLRSEGVLRGFHAEVDPRALGIGLQALIAVRLARHSRRRSDALRDRLCELPETLAVFHLAGRNDFLVQVAVHDVEHLRRFTLGEITDRDEVAHVETSLIFEEKRGWILPRFEGDAAERS
jgi:DNA-binding Lrp family transcriptional regulator